MPLVQRDRVDQLLRTSQPMDELWLRKCLVRGTLVMSCTECTVYRTCRTVHVSYLHTGDSGRNLTTSVFVSHPLGLSLSPTTAEALVDQVSSFPSVFISICISPVPQLLPLPGDLPHQ